MTWYYWLIVAALLSGALYVLFCSIVAPKLLERSLCKKGRTMEEARAFQEKDEHWDFYEYDEVWNKTPFELTSFDGTVLRGEYIVNPSATDINGRKKVVIVCHGHICNRIQSVKYATIFYNKGYNVVLYDNRFFGLSDGDVSTMGLKESRDLSEMIAYAKTLFGADAYIALHGESMGGATVLKVLENNADDVAYVIADCPFADNRRLFKEIIRSMHLPVHPVIDMAHFLAKRKYDDDFDLVSPIKTIGNADVPICFIHGTADKLIYPQHSKDLYAKCKNPLSELHLVEGALHARSHMKDREHYRAIVNGFIDKMENEVTK